jgi:hypothetical protein
MAMLGFGQIQNFLWSWLINHILPNLIACGLLLVVVIRSREPRSRGMFLVAAILGLLFLAGPIGLPSMSAFALWLCYRGNLLARSSGSPHSRRDALITLSLAVAIVALVVLYFVGYHVEPGTAVGYPVPKTGLMDQLKTGFRILCVSFGPVVVRYVRPLGLILFLLVVTSAILLLRTWFGQPQERLRASALLLFLGAMVGLLLAVERASGGLGWQLHVHGIYLNMAVPALCSVYLADISYGRRSTGVLTQVSLFTLSCLFFVPNFSRAIEVCQTWHEAQQLVEQDIRASVPSSIIAERD